jgi:hypothetical protein
MHQEGRDTLEERNRNKEQFFVTALGKQVKVTPMSLLLGEMAKNSVANPDAPVQAFEVDIEGQPPVHYPMRDIQDARNEHERRAWLLYEQRQAEANKEKGDRWINALLIGAVIDHMVMPEDNRWERRQKLVYIEIPDDPDEKRLHYLLTEVLTTPDDLTGLITKIVEISGVDEEVVESVEDSFRRSLRRPERPEAIPA